MYVIDHIVYHVLDDSFAQCISESVELCFCYMLIKNIEYLMVLFLIWGERFFQVFVSKSQKSVLEKYLLNREGGNTIGLVSLSPYCSHFIIYFLSCLLHAWLSSLAMK